MKDNFSKPEYVIVLGTTGSGSGAVFEYLDGRKDLYNPMGGEEYPLPMLPFGLMSLEAMSDKAFDPATTEHAIIQFKSIAYKLMNYWAKESESGELIKNLPLFKNAIDQFIEDISPADFPMRLFWRQLLESRAQNYFNKFKKYFGLKKKSSKARLLVSQNDLIIAAQKMHNKMFCSYSNDRPVLLDQGGTGWNPIESTKYFLNCKIVLVIRDPRDQYAEIKQYKGATSVEGYIDWYNEMQRRLKLIDDPKILIVQFENFVKNNEKITKILCDHMSISSNTSSNYQSILSKKNIGKYNQLLLKSEIELIENRLGKYIFNS